MYYRSEIDGLRAVAVLPVIFFHAGFSWFSGGYVGVDIFFVISGYLITSILIKELEQGKLSLINFYERRARRILPALFFVIICCIPFAWIWMGPTQLQSFFQAVFAITIFLSNLLFWQKTDYFAPVAEENPLLHTWSLGVEEQFYLFFPILLISMWRYGKSRIILTVLLLSIISLLLSDWASTSYPVANFYLLPTRAWELGAGALCAFILQDKRIGANQLYSGLGMILILSSIIFFDESTRFPSLYALVPVVGTSLIILFCSKETIVGKLLSFRALVGIGLISFSAYLWHQPLLAFARIRMLSEPPLIIMFLLSILSIFLAWFSWKYIEQPFRKKKGTIFSTRKSIFLSSILATAFLATLGLYGHFNNGFSERVNLPELLESDLYVRKHQEICFDFSKEKIDSEGFFCQLGYLGNSPKVAIVGDSHGLSFLPSFTELAEENKSSFIFSGVSSCPPIINTFVLRKDRRRDICNRRNKLVHRQIVEAGVETVVLIARWTNYTLGDISNGFVYLNTKYEVIPDRKSTLETFKKNLESTLKFYTSHGLKVVVFHQPPVQEVDAKSFYNHYYIVSDRPFEEYSIETTVSKLDHVERYGPVKEIIEKKISLFSNVESVDYSNILCDSLHCKIGSPERSYYLDDDHLSNFGASVVLMSYKGVIFN